MITTDLTPSPPIDLPGAVQVEQPRQLPSIRPIDLKQDLREALYNDGPIGPASKIQLPLEAITSLSGIVTDLDPGLLRPDNLLFPPSAKPAEFYEKIKPVLARHPLASQAEVRASGTGLHLIVRIDPPVELKSNGEQKYWDAIVKAVQRSLPADLKAPGITALTRAIGSINSKNGRPVEQLADGCPVRAAEIVGFVKQLSGARFRTIGRILLGADPVDDCPKCQKSGLTLYDNRGQCYSCGQLSLDDLFNTIYVGAAPDQACGTAKRKRKARKA
ncbi:MAG TPA: hypothetical protein VJY33_05275 [Isosphaeraceae bacterium]|nr:hypothetical protein [Isosphaeraceae bacterium]